MKKTLFTDFEKADNTVSVTLISNGLTSKGKKIGRVTRNVATLENLIASSQEEFSGIDSATLYHSACILQRQILKMLKQGHAVNFLDLGILYLGLDGVVTGERPDKNHAPDFTLRFTPSAFAKESVKSLRVDKYVSCDSKPYFGSIYNFWTRQYDCVTPGRTCLIKGAKLKLGGDVYSISFIPLDEDGNISKTSQPVIVEPDLFLKNTYTYLEFYVPENLDSDKKYVIQVKTSYLRCGKSRKTPVVSNSCAITVVE